MTFAVGLFFAVFIAVNVRFAIKFKDRDIYSALVSTLASWMYLLCMWVPALLQMSGRTTSKLVGPGVLPPPDWAEVSNLCFRWSLELAIVLLAEVISVRLLVGRQTGQRLVWNNLYEWRAAACLLLVVGALAMVVFPVDLSDRAESGQGIATLLRSCLVCGLAILAYFRAFRSPWLWLVLGMGLAVLIVGNVRSPISVVIVAAIAGTISRGAIYRLRVVLTGCVIVIMAVMVGAFMSDMRANITRSQGLSVAELVNNIARDPLAAPYRAGVDTLDGYRFSQYVADMVPASPSDLLAPLYTFIPRAVWSTKPESISVQLSADYLGYRSSGQFLSPIGYMTLSTGSYFTALILLAVTVALLASLVKMLGGSFWLALVLVVTFRMFLNGTSFDVYYGLSLLLPILVALFLCRFFFGLGSQPAAYQGTTRPLIHEARSST